METRKCKYCNSVIPADKRADTKFCSNSCKANYWEENKTKKKTPEIKSANEKDAPKVTGLPLEGLRGVIENKPQIAVIDVKQTSDTSEKPSEIRIETQAYKDAFAKVKDSESIIQRINNNLTECEQNLSEWEQEIQRLHRSLPKKRYEPTNIDSAALMDRLEDEYLYDDEYKKRQISAQLREVQSKLNVNAECKSKLEKALPIVQKRYSDALQNLKSILQYEVKKSLLYIPNLGNPIKNTPVLAVKEPSMTSENGYSEQKDTTDADKSEIQKSVPVQSNSLLISSRELRDMNYKCLNFNGRWQEFFGLPAVVFHLAVHGKPGEGKSTFCIQFADYLAKNFGHVVYISGEEGFSKTLRDKVVNNKIDNPYLYFANISSLEQIKSVIENNKFHFIFIDSLDTLKIDAARLRELREHYPQSAFITISQSTKDGKMRGSQEIIHDTDIAVKVEDGIAMTTKNRYHPRGTEFRVFPTAGKPAIKTMDEPRNII